MATGTLTRAKTRERTNGREDSTNLDEIAFCIPEDAYRLDGFRAWTQADDFPQYGRIAFIDGKVYVDMSKEELTAHALVKSQIGAVLTQIADGEKIGMTIIDGCRVVNEVANVSNVPDVVFLSFDSVESGRVILAPAKRNSKHRAEAVGSPDVVVEIVSNSSVGKDIRKLRAAYHAANIPEYWLVDARGDEIVFQILLHRRTGYMASPERDAWVRSRIFDREFRLVREENRIGLWTYRLETRGR